MGGLFICLPEELPSRQAIGANTPTTHQIHPGFICHQSVSAYLLFIGYLPEPLSALAVHQSQLTFIPVSKNKSLGGPLPEVLLSPS